MGRGEGGGGVIFFSDETFDLVAEGTESDKGRSLIIHHSQHKHCIWRRVPDAQNGDACIIQESNLVKAT